MNREEIWLLELWSGSFGAALSAAVAAAVAVVVLYFSNKHQSKEAAIARREAAEQSRTLLEAQEKGLREQLQEQKLEAALARRVTALAEVIAEAERFLWIRTLNLEVTEVMHRMRSATARLMMASPEDARLADVVSVWSVRLGRLALQSHSVREEEPGLARTIEQDLDKEVLWLTRELPAWVEAERVEKEFLIDQIQAKGEKLLEAISRADAKIAESRAALSGTCPKRVNGG